MRPSRTLSIVLVLLLMLTSCTSGNISSETPEISPAPTDVVMGRYVEEELSLPEALTDIVGMNQISDGSLWLFGLTAEDTAGHIWSSDDFGETWKTYELPWADQVEGIPDSAWFISPGELYLTSFVKDSVDLSGSSFAWMSYEGTYHFYRAGLAELEALDSSAIQNAATQMGVKEIRLTLGGDLLINCARNLLQMDGTGIHTKNEFPIGTVLAGRIAVLDDWIAANRNGQIEFYSLLDGQLGPTFSTDVEIGGHLFSGSRGQSIMSPHPAGEGLYFTNATGLYHAPAMEGEGIIQLIDGRLSSLSLPLTSFHYLFADSHQRFLTLTSNATVSGQYELRRYTFDTSITAEPTRELTVYALVDNATIRQAIGLFQQANPDVRVHFQIGASDGIIASDALRTLSTRLLSGEGPDVLILDGISVDSYVEKGILLDLAHLFDSKIEKGEFITNISNTYRRGNALYAIPARFSIPVIQGSDMGSIDDLSSLADYIVEGGVTDIAIFPENLVGCFYNSLSPNWFLPDGNLNIDRFTGDLADLKRIADSLDIVPEDDPNRNQRQNNGYLGLLANFLYADSIEVGIADVCNFPHLAGSVYAVNEGKADPVELFPKNGGVYVPGTVLGLNAESRNIELGEQFISFALSQDVLFHDFEDGFATNRAAIIARSQLQPWSANGNVASTGGMFYNPVQGDYEMKMIYYTWPEQGEIDAFISKFDRLNMPADTNVIVRQIIIEESAPYFAGEKTLEDTMASLQSKLDVYLNE